MPSHPTHQLETRPTVAMPTFTARCDCCGMAVDAANPRSWARRISHGTAVPVCLPCNADG
jgi:hypothetical protein